jgi:uracil-DNA glycosylase
MIDTLNQPIVFLLWGGSAKKLKKFITNPNRLILEANHPSPLSANRGGWFNNGHFVKTNAFLKENGLKEINWIR